ncbi:hypothetical protein GcM3_c11672o41 [Golovinomyces cichoracearum]|uniref:Uncharacterized protein n=1 Tax=Golovinomyces cichoracearum TaxID=62708 RepID=A0A420J9H1_9PEZI|nr:hypothetical protein GcM3_c11672o41 [Golovinomyces cichoracearum]
MVTVCLFLFYKQVFARIQTGGIECEVCSIVALDLMIVDLTRVKWTRGE